MQLMNEGATARPAIILIQSEPLQEYPHSQNVAVSRPGQALLLLSRTKVVDSPLHSRKQATRDGILRPRFVVQPRLQSAISLDQGFQRVPHVVVRHPGRFQSMAG